MDAESLLSRMRQELAPLREELVRIRELLERIERASSASPAGSFAEAAVPLPDVQCEPPPGPLEAARPEPEKREGAKLEAVTGEAPACSVPRADVEHSQPRTESAAATCIDPDEVELFGQLLRLYPSDAAAVFYGFDRQHRCSPEHLDRLAARAGLEPQWLAANRSSIGQLAVRFHGGRELIAETLGRDTDSLRALLDRTGMSEPMHAVRARERERLRAASLADRVHRILFRKRLLRDLGILQEMEENTRLELQMRCAELSGECDNAPRVLNRLGEECRLDSPGLSRLVQRFDLHSFVTDLFAESPDSERPAARRAERSEPRQPLADSEIEARILRMLLSKRKVGAAHTHIDHLVRTVPPHERGRAREIIERLLAEGTLVRKVTDNSAEPHVSLAVGAVPAAEERLRARPAAPGPPAVPVRGDRAT